jgi:16S rRNA (adenine1518-N6/adenine1519-N6)-dimethyltransferase
VLEIGPGLGALSLEILDAGASLIAVELDRRLEPVLNEVLAGRDARVVFDDAMSVDYRKLLGRTPTAVVANLPYQIATPLIMDLLVDVPPVKSLTVMVQKEVGERLVAVPGSDAYGAVSAKVAFMAEARMAFRVSRRVFHPMPDVESVVVRIDRRATPPARIARARLFGVIEAGFAQRRKTIRRALRGGGWPTEAVEAALTRAKVPGEARAETLGVPQFVALARALPPR